MKRSRYADERIKAWGRAFVSMKTILLILSICAALLTRPASAESSATTKETEKCHGIHMQDMKNIRQGLASVWFVPKDSAKVYIFDSMDGVSSKKYVIQGDLLVAGKQTAERICATYINRGKVVASGWLEKTRLKKLERVDFGSLDDRASWKNIEAARKTLITLSDSLPKVKNWQGIWKDADEDNVKIWKKDSIFKLDTTGIRGVIGTGNDDEDSQELSIESAMAVSRELIGNGVCNLVIVGFNNALLATLGAHCMGSGFERTWPTFSGIYWKK